MSVQECSTQVKDRDGDGDGDGDGGRGRGKRTVTGQGRGKDQLKLAGSNVLKSLVRGVLNLVSIKICVLSGLC